MLTRPKRRLPIGQRIRAVVIDDSVVLRQLVARALEQDPAIEVLGSAPNAAFALERMVGLHPDVVCVDLGAPELNGLERLRQIRREFPEIRVVVFSWQSEGGSSANLDTLSLLADDYVAQTAPGDPGLALRTALVSTIKELFLWTPDIAIPATSPPKLDGVPTSATGASKSAQSFIRPQVIVIGISAGGPEALSSIFPQIPADLAIPILIVQHMPPRFTGFLCQRLQALSKMPISEAADGEKLDTPKILLAPGGFHMRLVQPSFTSPPAIALDQGPRENACRPAADALFVSAAQVCGAAVLAIVMTGMGRDGVRGAGALKAQGAYVIAQDESSSTVWGMPRAVIEAGLADLVVPLQRIVPEMLHYLDRFPKNSSPSIKKQMSAVARS
jgi:two-component system chemotaxis response regulator CheB